jgi:hypothetical protein
MSNHLHFVLKCGAVPLSVLMMRLLTGYAVAFNLRHERVGHLFQNRFGSRMIRGESDLLGVIRYVLRNPLEAGLAVDLAALERFEWSALGALLGHRPPFPFEAVGETLGLLGKSEQEARTRLRSLVATSSGEAEPDQGTRLDALVREVCTELGVSEYDLRARRRTEPISLARARICRRAVSELGLRPSEVARALHVTPGAVSQALRREDSGRSRSF